MRPPKFEKCVIREIPNFDENFTDHEVLVHNACALWYVLVETFEDDGKRWIGARLHFEENPMNLKFKIFYSIKFLNNKDSAQEEEEDVKEKIVDCEHYYPGDDLLMEKALDENSGYLENEVLKIQVLFHLESIISIDEYSQFNFLSPPFNYWEKGQTITFETTRDQDVIYCHHQLIKLHSKTISDAFEGDIRNFGLGVPDIINFHYLHRTLQILHGVFFPLKFDCDYSSILYLLHLAHFFEIGNVTRFLDRQLVETRSNDEFSRTLVLTAVEFKLENLLKVMLRKCDSVESFAIFLSILSMKEKADDPGVDEMSSEAMKSVVAKFLSLD